MTISWTSPRYDGNIIFPDVVRDYIPEKDVEAIIPKNPVIVREFVSDQQVVETYKLFSNNKNYEPNFSSSYNWLFKQLSAEPNIERQFVSDQQVLESEKLFSNYKNRYQTPSRSRYNRVI